jgi:RNA polymerase sigma-70 factor (ECF subfamily)
MDDQEWLAKRFEANRSHLRGVAYRMLGSVTEADDAVQEAWIRLSRADTSNVENLQAWLTTVVARVSLNMLRSRKTRREAPLDTYVPYPVLSPQAGMDPEQEAMLGDSVGPALLVVLDSLTPAERVAFVLHDVFAVPFDAIAPIVGRTPAAARQLASRAAVASRVRPCPTSISMVSGRSWTPSLPRRVAVTSNASSLCSTRRSCCVPTEGRRVPSWSRCSAARRP